MLPSFLFFFFFRGVRFLVTVKNHFYTRFSFSFTLVFFFRYTVSLFFFCRQLFRELFHELPIQYTHTHNSIQ